LQLGRVALRGMGQLQSHIPHWLLRQWRWNPVKRGKVVRMVK
jgi:hypothetical protein